MHPVHVTIDVKLATPENAVAIATLLMEAFNEYKPSYTDAAFKATTLDADLIASRISCGHVWIARSDHQILGTVTAEPTNSGIHIRSMAVHPIARGNGIARLLLKHIEQVALANNYTRLFLSTTPFLTSAIHLYERSGFVRKANGTSDLFGTPIFSMEKHLS